MQVHPAFAVGVRCRLENEHVQGFVLDGENGASNTSHHGQTSEQNIVGRLGFAQGKGERPEDFSGSITINWAVGQHTNRSEAFSA